MGGPAFDPRVLDPARLASFWWFVCERQTIWHRRFVARLPPPWTSDPTLQRERFTNVYRELDPGTRYAVERILEVDAPAPDRVFNVMLYRLIGRAGTHAALGFQLLETFDAARLEAGLKAIRASGRAPFTAAYTVSGYHSMGSADKCENVARLFGRLHTGFSDFWERLRRALEPADAHRVLASPYGFGNFLAYQVLVDLTYPLRGHDGRSVLSYSQDAWASAGPGARRGIAVLAGGRRVDGLAVMRWLRDAQQAEIARLGLTFRWLLDDRGLPVPLTLANVQNCLCEFHKYVKIRAGAGRGRRRFAVDVPPGDDRGRDGAYPVRGVM